MPVERPAAAEQGGENVTVQVAVVAEVAEQLGVVRDPALGADAGLVDRVGAERAARDLQRSAGVVVADRDKAAVQLG